MQAISPGTRLALPPRMRSLPLLVLVLFVVACGPAPPDPVLVTIDVYSAGAEPRVALADLDGDRRVDLVLAFGAEHEDQGIVVRHGAGDGTFGPPGRVLVGRASFGVADVDGDGRADLVVHDGWNVGVLAGGQGPMRVVARVRGGRLLSASAAGALTIEDDASLMLRAWTAGEPARIDPAPLTPMAIGDVDGDGAPELVGVALGRMGTRGSIASAPVRLLDALASADVVVGDVDGDGVADVVTWGGRHLTVVGRAGRITTFPIPGDVSAVAVADLDGDRRPDLVLAAPGVLVSRCAALAFAPCARARGPWGDPRGLGVGDLDGDARPEIVVADRATKSVMVVRGLGVGSAPEP